MHSSVTGARWLLREVEDSRTEALQSALGVDRALARCLALRGARLPDQARSLMEPSMEHLHDPWQMHGMAVAVERLRKAIHDGDMIRVVTDYDVDGTTSSLILQGTLRVLGSDRVSYHIPDRMDEGYGFSVRAAEKAAADGIRLIVTADIGVKDHAAVRRARELGVDVIVCDHHLPPGEDVPPDATAVLCPPQRACSYPNRALAACGVSLKVAQALLEKYPRKDLVVESLLKLAAIGTVADVVDLLTQENRAIVALGLKALNTTRNRPGLANLLRVSGLSAPNITSSHLAWRVGPRINAAGRIASATAVVELLSSNDPDFARTQAQLLDELNSDRKNLQDAMIRRALMQVPSPLPGFVVVADYEGEAWHRGVAGIVASRLREDLNRPTAVIAITPRGATGSVRAGAPVHAVRGLDRAAHLLERYGGHPAAAGFSLPAEKIEELRTILNAYALEVSEGREPALTRDVDVDLPAEALGMGLLRSLEVLQPHGQGNPEPRIAVYGGRVARVRPLRDKDLKAELQLPNGRTVGLVWWGGGPHRAALEEGRPMVLLGQLGLNVYQGIENVQMQLDDVAFAD